MTLTDRHLETTARGVCALGSQRPCENAGSGAEPKIRQFLQDPPDAAAGLCATLCTARLKGTEGLLPNPADLDPSSPHCPLSPLRGAVEGQRSVPNPRQLSIETAPGTPLQSLNHGKPPPWGSCPGGHRPALRPQGRLWPGVGG